MNQEEVKIDKAVIGKVEDLAKELFALIGIAVKLKVTHDKENEAVLIDLETSDSAGLLIGRRGENIAAIQSILGMMVSQKLGGWVRVIVNVGDYREKQENELRELATQTAERARETGLPQSLYNLTASQRRIIHMTLTKEKDLSTESEGEGRDRHLVIAVKK